MISLTISERILVLTILNDFKGNMETMATVLEDIKQLPIEDEEWVKAERKEKKVDTSIQWTWDDDKGGLKEVDLQKQTVAYLKKEIKTKDDAGEITLQDKALISLSSKL